jgi:hypothetical protein
MKIAIAIIVGLALAVVVQAYQDNNNGVSASGKTS